MRDKVQDIIRRLRECEDYLTLRDIMSEFTLDGDIDINEYMILDEVATEVWNDLIDRGLM